MSYRKESKYGGRGGRGSKSRGREIETTGRPPKDAVMVSNFFEIVVDNMKWIQYGIDWGGAENRRTRLRIYRKIMLSIASEEERKYCVFDGNSIYTFKGIEKASELNEFKVEAYGLEYTIRITGQTEVTNYESLLQIYNILVKQLFKINQDFIEIRRRFFEKKPLQIRDKFVSDRIKIFPGYHTQVTFKRFGNANRLVLNVDVTHKILSNESVLHILNNIKGKDKWSKSTKKKARKNLVKKVIFTHYNTKSYTIENIDFERSPKDKFKYTNPKTLESRDITYIEYYQKIYGLTITDPNQPLIKASGRGMQTVYLIPELSITTNISADAKAMLPKTCSVKPHDRAPRIERLPSLFRSQSERTKEFLDRFRFRIDNKMIPVKYKTLEKPDIIMPGVSAKAYSGKWGPDLRNINYKVSDPRGLVAFITHNRRDQNFANEISEKIRDELDKIQAAYTIKKIIKIEVKDSHLDALVANTDWKRYSVNNKEVVVLSVIEDSSIGVRSYKEIKEYCDREGYIHQAVNSRNFAQSKIKSVIIGNLARQILNKKDELCYKISVSKCAPFLTGKSILIIGIDVYHSRIDYDEENAIYFRRRSIKAFTAYAVHSSGRYKTFNHCVSTTGGQEVLCSESDGSSVASGEQPQPKIVKEEGQSEEGPILGKFINRICEKLNMKKFDLIIVYRDGVADSQIEAVIKEEVEDVRKSAPDSKLAYFVVQKDIKQKFFLYGDNSYFNTKEGTIVDADGVNPQPESESISQSQPRDFYLVSCATNLSTNKPVRYVSLYLDDVCTRGNNFTELQNLTYALCHMYPNWPGIIKVPHVTQLAHKLAYHIGELSVKDPEIHDDLFNSMFYL